MHGLIRLPSHLLRARQPLPICRLDRPHDSLVAVHLPRVVAELELRDVAVQVIAVRQSSALFAGNSTFFPPTAPW
jgi:hypothetical protein